MNTVPASLLLDQRHQLGEGITWCSRSQWLYWTDIEGSALYRARPDGQSLERFALPERLGCFSLCDDAAYLLMGLESRLAFFHLASATLHTIVPVETGLPTRVNDGRCDRAGRFVFGTMDEATPHQPVGSFYRLNRDLTLERLPLPNVHIPNSIAFSPDASRMYYCDTLSRTIRCCDYSATGVLSNDRLFVALSDPDGYPDGSTIDAAGGLWNAQWGGRRVVRYGPDGQVSAEVVVPSAQPSCVAFGGPQLDTLYITTARVELAAQDLLEDPYAGGIFRAAVRFHGLDEPLFGGQPARAVGKAGAV